MIPTANMILTLEKELELERNGLRRTRRWIGDASQVTDERWYRGTARQLSVTGGGPGEVSRTVETNPCPEARRSILARLFTLRPGRTQPAFTDC